MDVGGGIARVFATPQAFELQYPQYYRHDGLAHTNCLVRNSPDFGNRQRVDTARCSAVPGQSDEVLGGRDVSAVYQVCPLTLEVTFDVLEGHTFTVRACALRASHTETSLLYIDPEWDITTLTKYSPHASCCQWRQILPFCICAAAAGGPGCSPAQNKSRGAP